MFVNVAYFMQWCSLNTDLFEKLCIKKDLNNVTSTNSNGDLVDYTD